MSTTAQRQAILNVLDNTLRTWSESAYCIGSLALDAQGNRCHTTSHMACRWCVMGVVDKYTRPNGLRNTVLYDTILDEIGFTLSRIGDETGISYANDTLGYSFMYDVLMQTRERIALENYLQDEG